MSKSKKTKAAAKPAKVAGKTKVKTKAVNAAPPNDAKPKALSCLDAAAQVLKSKGEPMRCREMVAAMSERKLWHSDAPTPHATLYSALLREITVKGADARFEKTGRGHFALRAYEATVNTKLPDRDARYFVEDGCLCRRVTASDGRSYHHRCLLAAYEAVAHAIEETPAKGQGTTQLLIARQESLAHTQVNVALEFLKERGIVTVRHRRCYPASNSVHLDAMVEYHALAEQPKPA